MAEIITSQKSGRRKVAQPRIDLTPMVDLGFLLITFFMYTTTMSERKMLPLDMPSTEPTSTPTKFAKESTITLMLTANDKVVYYVGVLESPEQLQQIPMKQLRDLLLDKKKAAAALPASFSADAHKLHVIIKPCNDSKYNNMVQTLDELMITGVTVPAIVDATQEELSLKGKKFPN